MMTAPNEIVARRLLKQAEWCQKLGSRLYSTLLRQAAEDVRAAGVCSAVLHDHHDDPPDSALALRFLGAIHRLVLQKKAPQLAACYPSAGGNGDCDELWRAFHAVVRQHTAVLRELVRRPVQTNEVGRCAALLGGFLEVVRRTGLPLRLLEVGAAGGLILRWDQYRYEAGDEGWGDPDSPVRICGALGDVHSPFDVPVKIAERRGCDASPIDPCTEEGELTLQSYVWPDQVERFRQLAAAIEVARRVPAQVDQANAADWVEAALAERVSGVATVVYHSIVWQYLSNEDRARFKRVMAVAGQAATHDNPLAWLRFEPGADVAEVRLQLWPGGEDRLLAQSGFHGKPVQWLGCEN
jgi:hypothetical protein